MSRGLHPRECDALNMLEAGESIGVVAQLCRLTREECAALAVSTVGAAGTYDDTCAAISGRAMFDDELTSGAWWVS